MNTLKKTVAVVLAVAMVLTMGIATAFATYPDVPSTANYAEAVNILTNLGIFQGTDDGTFKPDNTITRAEVAAIIVRALDLDEQKGTTPFTDVPADHWAAGYINTAYAKGVINGCGDGTFLPGGEVTYEQAVKMIVAALGYTPKADKNGGYPTGYLGIASEEGITSGALGTVGQPATRATVAKLVYNALEVGMMEQTTYGDTTEYGVNEDKTLLSGLGVEKHDVVVTDTYLTTAAANNEYDPDDTTVTLGFKKTFTYDGTTYEKESGDEYAAQLDFEEGGTAASSLLGYACVAYIGVDDDTDEDTIFAISAKGTKNTVTTVKGDMLAAYDELADSEQEKSDDKGTVYYWKNSKSDRKPSSLTPDTDVKVFVNYVEDSTIDENSEGTAYKELIESSSGKGGVLEFIDNDGDGDFNVVIVSAYTKEGVVDEIEVNDDGEYTFSELYGEVPETYDPEDDDVLKLFIKGENYIDVSEVAEGDTITTIASDDDESSAAIIIYQVSSDKLVDAKCTTSDTEAETITVAGKAYQLSPNYEEKTIKDLRSVEGTFYLNSDGLISYVDGDSLATGDYGFIVATDDEVKYSKTTYSVKIVDNQGKSRTYNLKSKVKVYQNDGYTNMDAEEAFDILQELENGVSSRIIKYDVDNDELSKVIVTTGSDSYDKIDVASYTDKTYDSEDKTLGSSDSFADNAIVFALDSTDDDDLSDDDNVSVSGISIFKNDSKYTAYTYSEDDEVVAVLAIDPTAAIDYSQHVFVVSSFEVGENDDGDVYVDFTGIQDGSTTKFRLYDDDDNSLAEDIDDGEMSNLAKGTVLLVGEEVNGFVDEIEYLVVVTKDGSVLDAITMNYDYTKEDNGDKIYADLAQIESYSSSDGVIIPGYTTDDEGREGYKPKSGTRLVVVDFTSNRISGATVKTASGASSAFNFDYDTKYDGYAFFRMYDIDDEDVTDLLTNKGEVQDIVVYKLNKGEGSVDGSTGGNNGGTVSNVDDNSTTVVEVQDTDDDDDVVTVVDGGDTDVIIKNI